MPTILWFCALGLAIGNLQNWYTERARRLALQAEITRIMAPVNARVEQQQGGGLWRRGEEGELLPMMVMR